jgi:hypothetical protein
VRKKVISPEHRRAAKAMVADGLCSGRGRVPVLEDVTGDILVSAERANEPGAAAAQATQGAEREARSLRQSAHRRVIAAGRLGGGQKARPALAAFHWSAGAAEQAQGAAPRRLHGDADEGRAPGPCLELGLHLGWHHARRSLRMLTILDEYTRECHVLRRPGA